MNQNLILSNQSRQSGAEAQAELRPMQEADLPFVLTIINQHDEDDAEEAEESYAEQGLENQFVLVRGEEILGVSGFRYAAGTIGTAWLSWTYLRKDAQQQGLGTWMLNAMLQRMREENYRKIFVSTSDYVDPNEGPIYAAANQLYQNVGFRQEVVHPDYFDVGESQIVYGLTLQSNMSIIPPHADNSCLLFNGLFEIPETDDVYVINWDVQQKKLFGRNQQFTAQDLQLGLETAREWEARAVFISFPSNMPSVLPPLQAAGFVEEGRLKDYYEDGIDELRFRFNL
jgi:ribosomal protein S18 acetylase RimI-like enzyme